MHNVRLGSLGMRQQYDGSSAPPPYDAPLAQTAESGSCAILSLQLGTVKHCYKTRCIVLPLCITWDSVAAEAWRRYRPLRYAPCFKLILPHMGDQSSRERRLRPS